jgi:plastocyanin
MFRPRHTIAIALALLATFALTANAGGDKIKFPEGYNKGVLYGTVDRYDIKQYRELWANKEAVDAVKAGKPIPHGTVLTLVQYKAKVDDKGVPVKDTNGRFQKGDLVAYTVMEKGKGWGTEYADDVRNGEWEYQVFGADTKVNDKANLKGCFGCHKPHEKQDFVISLARFSGSSSGAGAKPAAGVIAVADFLFGPEKFEAKTGQKVTWTNVDDSPHQVTLVSADGKQGKRTGIMLRGQSESMTFDAAGVYNYICGLHPNMKGTIEVK